MKLHGTTMLRNEADVVEAFVRHNLGVLDGLSVVDHGSTDGTSEILAALVREGLPVDVRRDEGVAYLQSETMSAATREAFHRHAADFVFALDADEFLKVPSRALLEQVLAGLPTGMHAAMHWQTYVPDFNAPSAANAPFLARQRLAQERHGLHKVIVGRSFAEDGNAVLGPGNHLVLPNAGHSPSASPVRHARVSAEVVALAHLPVRSARQLTNKIIVGWLAHCAARRSDPDLAFHWRELYEEITTSPALSTERLRTIAANYGIARSSWLPLSALALIDDPLPPSAAHRYDALVAEDTLRLGVKFAERLALAR